MPQGLRPVAAARRKPQGRPASPAVVRRRPWWRRLMRGVMWTLTAIACVALFATSYAGELVPSVYRGACILVMVFPFALIAVGTVAVLDLLVCRRALLLVAVSVAGCIPAIWDYMPLNIMSPKAGQGAPTFTMLTYNVSNFTDLTGRYPGDVNPTISYILRTNADIVNLQEAKIIGVSSRLHITPAQIDSLYRAYPYVVLGCYSQAVLSKYPVKSVETGAPVKGGNEIAVFRINIEGEQVTLFNVHLQSYKLSKDDKSLYREITDLNKNETDKLGEIRSQLLSKIQAAAEGRENDVARLGRYINRYGGPNVIVAGDFNDVPGSYPLHYLSGFGLREVYPEVGFGPMITFNSDRFYFRIDHVLYRGAIKPLMIDRGRLRSSDHYPLLVRFELTSAD